MSHLIKLKIVKGVFKAEKEEISVIVYRIKFTKHSRALVSSSTIELVLQLFSSFLTQATQHHGLCSLKLYTEKNVILFNPSRNVEHMLSLYLSYMNT